MYQWPSNLHIYTQPVYYTCTCVYTDLVIAWNNSCCIICWRTVTHNFFKAFLQGFILKNFCVSKIFYFSDLTRYCYMDDVTHVYFMFNKNAPRLSLWNMKSTEYFFILVCLSKASYFINFIQILMAPKKCPKRYQNLIKLIKSQIFINCHDQKNMRIDFPLQNNWYLKDK